MSVAIRHETTSPLRNLYQGEYWTLAKSLEELAVVGVVSAGMGLTHMDSPGVGYGATFAAKADDSVLRFVAESENPRLEWWQGLRQGGIGERGWSKLFEGVALVAVSESYQKAIATDLIYLAQNGHSVIVVSGSRQVSELRDVPGIAHLEIGQWVRMILGGSTPCVGIRFVAHLLEQGAWQSVEAASEELATMEAQYLRASTAKLPVLDRTPRDDAQVKNWIMETLKQDRVGRSKTAFLAAFRAEGFACEQKRFGRIFEEVVKN